MSTVAPSTIKAVKRDNVVISYRIIGNGSKTLLFLHGSYIDQSYWDHQVESFSNKYKVVTLDLPGHGSSGRERKSWSTDSFADDVVFVIRKLELENVVIIAHSWGADVGLIAAVRYPTPVVGFIAIDYFKNAGTPVVPQQEADGIKANLKKDFISTNEGYCRFALLTPNTPDEITNRVVNDFKNAYEPMGQVVTPEIFDMYKIEQELLPKLHCKLDIINVDYQPTNEQLLKKYCPHGYALHHIKGTSHFPMIESPNELDRLIESILGQSN